MIDYLKILLNLPDQQRNSLVPVLKSILQESQFQELAKLIATIQDDPNEPLLTRQNTLERIARYTASSKLHSKIDMDTGEYTPKLSKFQFIKVNFAGIGSEMDLHHYAIIWDTSAKKDTVKIIPTTSLKETTVETFDKFNIGKIGFLKAETVVMLDQVMPISRKRIVRSLHVNPKTKKPQIVTISESQKRRIQDGFRIMDLGEKSLFDVILDDYRHFLPEFTDPVQFEHLICPVRPILPQLAGLFTYVIPSNPAVHYTIKWHGHNLTKADRKTLLYAWAKAAAITDPSNKRVIITSKSQAKQNAYLTIQSAYAK